MGVVYKLVPEVSSFIIEQKQKDPKITCQHLAGTVFLKFGQKVSKSSVHELLKQAHVITPRPRKQPKEKFQIPSAKKEQISKAMAPFAETRLPAETQTSAAREIVLPNQETIAATMIPTQIVGEIFLKAALWDLSFKAVLGLKDFSDIYSLPSDNKIAAEWKYLTQQIFAIKIQTTKGSFYIDPRFQGLHQEFLHQEFLTTPIERAAGETADTILNNTQPLIIKDNHIVDTEVLTSFFAAFENNSGVSIEKIFLIGDKNREFVEFNFVLPYKRKFIMGISIETQNFASLRLRILKKDGKKVITNILTHTDEEIWQQYIDRHPSDILTGNLSKEKESTEPFSLPKHIKNRVQIFFEANLSDQALEEILNLSGTEETDDKWLKVHFQAPKAVQQLNELRRAVENINNLHIKNNKGKILRLSV
jgi:hypothetical protein